MSATTMMQQDHDFPDDGYDDSGWFILVLVVIGLILYFRGRE